MMPIIFGLAAVLVIVGIIILIVVFTSSGGGLSLFASKTPTSTNTATATATVPSPTASSTPTITETPTITMTETPSGPREYKVQSGDTCYDLAITFDVDLAVMLAINNFGPSECPIQPGDTILIPLSGQTLPTMTPVPSDLPRGTIIEYTVQSGDTLSGLASRFNSTAEDIIARNPTTVQTSNNNRIDIGSVLKIAVNIVTPTPTRGATSTLASAGTILAPTKSPTVTPTVTP